MPRTRQVKNVPKPTEGEWKFYHEQYKQVYMQQRQRLIDQKEMILQNFKLLSKQDRLTIPVTLGNKTLKELRLKSYIQTFSSTSLWPAVDDVGQSVNTESSKKDDGYLTSDSQTDNSGRTRSSRATSTTRSASKSSFLRPPRMSRSLSRNMVLEKASTINKPIRKSRSVSRNRQTDKYKTPSNTRKLENFGSVKPKINPNTPVVLRRPQQGEVAFSLQGSPLMTNVGTETANVNIPLGDGRMINIQPKRGLRRSQIPDLDQEIQRQLKTLRDNLDKVCQFSSMK